MICHSLRELLAEVHQLVKFKNGLCTDCLQPLGVSHQCKGFSWGGLKINGWSVSILTDSVFRYQFQLTQNILQKVGDTANEEDQIIEQIHLEQLKYRACEWVTLEELLSFNSMLTVSLHLFIIDFTNEPESLISEITKVAEKIPQNTGRYNISFWDKDDIPMLHSIIIDAISQQSQKGQGVMEVEKLMGASYVQEKQDKLEKVRNIGSSH